MKRELDPRLTAVLLAATREISRDACLQTLAVGARRCFGGLAVLTYAMSAGGDDLLLRGFDSEPTASGLREPLALLDAGLIRQTTTDQPVTLADAELLVPTGEPGSLPELGEALLVPLHASPGFDGLLLLVFGPSIRIDAEIGTQAGRLAAELKPALDNLRVVEALRDLAIRDDTADCFNRRHLDRSIDDETERARRFNGRFGLIFVDMDNLKEVNTRFGHGAGSRALYEASVRMRRCVRSIDQLFRYGGDEFVILLPGTSLDGAREVAERVRREIAGKPFDMPGGHLLELTASTGVSAWPEHGPEARTVLEAGDAAMRRVKAAGKNAVGVAQLPEEPLP
ncbi:MAG: GGDEF domain-containing protein [Acidobacteriota bacterium]